MSKKPAPIEIFVRHCNYSNVSAHKKRPKGFSKQKCLENLLDTVDGEKNVQITFLLDTYHPMQEEHFLYLQNRYPTIECKAGSETLSFSFLLDYVLSQKLLSETILYFLEDDYLHREGWVAVLREAFTLPCSDYVTLYDHKDKYFFPQYEDLRSQLFHTTSCHWRTTPSTTNTYAMKLSTLKRDEAIHRQFSREGTITKDHEKFCELNKRGATLISSIPGYSTHLEPDYASPCTNWEKLLDSLPIKEIFK